MTPKSTMDNSDKGSGSTDNAGTNTKSVDPGKEKFQLARRNTIKTLLIVGLCFIICWFQNQVIFFMYNCGYDLNFNTTYFQFTVVMVFLNCIVNPFIYHIMYSYYQDALRAFFHCFKEGRNNSLNSSTIASSNI